MSYQVRKSSLRSSRGFVKVLLLGGLFLSLFATATQVIPIYYRHFEIESQMRALSQKYPKVSADDIRKRLEFELIIQQIPVKPDALRVYLDGDTLIVSLRYAEELAFRFREKRYVLHTFSFDTIVKQLIRE